MGPPRFEGGRDKAQVVPEFEVGREPPVAVRRQVSEVCPAPGLTCSGKKSTDEWKSSFNGWDYDCGYFEYFEGGTEVSSCRGLFPC